MGIKFLNGGFLTTIQDMGRTGYQESGMSVSGVMDQRSAALANILVGNDENEGVMEVTLMGPMAEFTADNIIAVTGANLGAKLNGKELPMYQAVQVHKGDSLSFAGMFSGSRAYVAFAGGMDIPVIMGSKSTNLKSRVGGYEGRKLGAGDEIAFTAPKTTLPNMHLRKIKPDDFTATEQVLRVVMGPQDDYFTEKGLDTFLSATYAFTNESDRMGCRCEGEVIEHKNGGDIITDGIAFGAIQVPSHGQPIIMMADHQTTGGYTKIASVISVDLPKVAQSRPGYKVKFHKVSIEEAQELYIAQVEEFKALKEKLSKAPEPAAERDAVIQAAVAHEASKYWGSAGTYKVRIDGEEFIVELQEERTGLR